MVGFRTRLLALVAVATGTLLHAADDSPVFVVQNEPFPAGLAVPADDIPPVHGRRMTAGIDGTRVFARLGDAPPVVLDPDATAACPPAFVAFPDDSALVVWRGHAGDDARDLRFARFADGAWNQTSTLVVDGWKTTAVPPGEGPALAHRGPHVAAAWFSGDGGPRVNVAVSGNAGEQWLQPVRVDDGAPIGRVSVVLLDDGAQLVSWVERVGDSYAVLLRRLSPRGTLSVPARLAFLAADPGHPKLSRVKDGDATPAQLRLDYRDENGPVARLITLPPPTTLAEAEACDCDPRPEDQRGFGFVGRVSVVDPAAGTIAVAHGAIPGVMKAGTTAFKASPDLIAAARRDSRILARMERLGPDWWLIGFKTLGAP